MSENRKPEDERRAASTTGNRVDERTYYERINAAVRQIPPGRVATYGQIAGLVGGVTARMVGYAMAALPQDSDVPWQRVINSQGKISPHGAGFGSAMQRTLLEEEGLQFDHQNRIDLSVSGWLGPVSGGSPGPSGGGRRSGRKR